MPLYQVVCMHLQNNFHSRNLTYVLETPLDEDEKLQSHSATTAVSSAHDRTLHSHSEVTLGQALTPVVGTGGGSRPGSARRQWKDSSHSEVSVTCITI